MEIPQRNVQTKMSFSIEELAKSSRLPESLHTNAIVSHIHEVALPYNSISQSPTEDITLRLSMPIYTIGQRSQNKRKWLDDSVFSDESISSSNSTSRDCTSSGSCSDDSETSINPPKKKARTTFTNSQLLELERYYSNSKYLQIEDRPLLAKKLKLSQHKVKWWFQNRRMKEKRHIKSTSYNSSSDLTQFVGVGKPCPRTTKTGFQHQKYSFSVFPSPILGYSNQLYSQ
ncbi:unnamed protein product [Mytilus coruscus]|uniref:Homeobox domain-containing protein n=1 Tax=Mytilus coruscus TaxID=42192 RepID=A0A6J8AIC8_MYTCO|nr:unnamed protein product [Mytilus coruscus]